MSQNAQLAEELHKPIIRKFRKRKVYSAFKDNIWGADLADMQLITKFNKGFRFLLCVIDIFSKYTCVVPLKDKKGVNIVNAFQKISDDLKRKPNKIWVDKRSEFYNRSMKSWLQDNDSLTVVENKIPDASSLVKKTDYNTKISDIEKKIIDHDHDKYITTPEFNTMASSTFNARLAAQTDLIRKPEFDAKLKIISDRVTLNNSKHLLVEDELKKLEKSDDGTQNYLVFQPMYKYFKTYVKGSTTYVSSWESKGLSNENISSITTSNHDQGPSPAYDNARIKLKFVGDLLKQDKVTYNHGPIVNIYIIYRLSPSITSDITLENCLFGAVKLTKNLKINTFSGYGVAVAFYAKGNFSNPSGGYGKNVIIFGADLSSSVHANNRANNILVLGKDLIQGINGTAISAERMYSTNFTVTNKKFCLSLHYNGDSSYLFVNGKEIVNFKAKDSKTVPYTLCLGNVSKEFSPLNPTNTKLYGYTYDFSVNYGAIANDKILDIHKYFMEKNNIK